MARVKTVLAVAAGIGVASVATCVGVLGPCWSAWLLDGILVGTCPEGDVRPVVRAHVYGVGRKDEGTVNVAVDAHYYDPSWRSVQRRAVGRVDVDLALVAPDGTEREIEPEETAWWGDGWDDAGDGQQARVRLPDVPDGDWLLRVRTDSPAGEASVDVPLPLYAPALGHVLTDSPLYEPGGTVRFRAVLLGEGDLVPLEGRPGTWVVRDPQGEVLLEEKGKTGPFGVASATFPLDAEAASGGWTVAFQSGAASPTATFQVRPFELPKMTVEASTPQRAWFVGEEPVVEGAVRYTSGAPVANARVRVRPRASGGWPPPPAWLEERELTTDAQGRFRVDVGDVPSDLLGTATIAYALEAADAGGEVARGSASVLLSADRVLADAVTELGEGLVADQNNRVWVRVTAPDGQALDGAEVRLRRDGVEGDPWLTGTADADGVARFQLDPGEPVTVVVPPMPVRARPRAEVAPVTLESATERLRDQSADLQERAAADRWTDAVAPCAAFVASGTRAASAAVLLTPAGRVALATARGDDGDDGLARCIEGRLSGQAGPGGRDRLLSVRWIFADPGTPRVATSGEIAAGEDPGVAELVSERVATARACASRVSASARLPRSLVWQVREGSAAVRTTWADADGWEARVDGATAGCVERAVGALALRSPAGSDAMGVVHLRVDVPVPEGVARPQPTTFPGFAYEVVASRGGEEIGRTLLRAAVGAVPDLRLRASEVLVDPGAEVEIVALRGPDFSGTFPEELRLMQGDRELTKFDFDPKARKGTLKVPGDAAGFVHVEWSGARTVLYVRPAAALALALSTDRPTYKPGETATLTVRATDGAGPVAAGVTLSGVDATLAALAPLPSPDAWADVTVRATSATPAFGVLDARALQTGLIRGENAAQAAVLRVTGLPPTPPGATRVTASAEGTFDPVAETEDAFYAVYARARRDVRAWEERAPAGEVFTAAQMVEVWGEAARAVAAEAEASGGKVPADPFGRTLRLSTLPAHLLALTDPRLMVADGARLPEDVENWTAYVAAEAP